jgi:hypothetical protein
MPSKSNYIKVVCPFDEFVFLVSFAFQLNLKTVIERTKQYSLDTKSIELGRNQQTKS